MPASDSDVVLVAQWTLIGFDVIFDEQGGSTVPNDFYNESVNSITLPQIERAGYTFTGWWTASIGGSRVGGRNESYAVPGSGDVTYYAQWTVNRYFIYYNNNASTRGGLPAPQFGVYESSITVKPNDGGSTRIPLTRTGYTFGGWNTRADGTGINYTAGTGVYTFGAQNQTLFARWIPNAYIVTFSSDGGSFGTGSGSMAPQNTLHGVTVALNNFAGLVAPAGKSFDGWSTTPGGVRVYTNGQNITPTGNITLYARWLQQP
jgi:uncharacterized repeat protein (TIGR02543 family)